jgi:hypothetical protein
VPELAAAAVLEVPTPRRDTVRRGAVEADGDAAPVLATGRGDLHPYALAGEDVRHEDHIAVDQGESIGTVPEGVDVERDDLALLNPVSHGAHPVAARPRGVAKRRGSRCI